MVNRDPRPGKTKEVHEDLDSGLYTGYTCAIIEKIFLRETTE